MVEGSKTQNNVQTPPCTSPNTDRPQTPFHSPSLPKPRTSEPPSPPEIKEKRPVLSFSVAAIMAKDRKVTHSAPERPPTPKSPVRRPAGDSAVENKLQPRFTALQFTVDGILRSYQNSRQPEQLNSDLFSDEGEDSCSEGESEPPGSPRGRSNPMFGGYGGGEDEKRRIPFLNLAADAVKWGNGGFSTYPWINSGIYIYFWFF